MWRKTTVDWISVAVGFSFAVDWRYKLSAGHQRWVPDVSTQSPIAERYSITKNPERWQLRDPMPDIYASLNQLMFRCAVAAARWSNASSLIDPGLSVEQSVSAQVTSLVFKSDLSWFAGAAILELGAVILILPMFWGFWTLGTTTSLSPLSAALAFDAPLFKDVNSHGGAKGVVQQLGNVKVRFGHVLEDEDGVAEETSADVEDDCVSGRLGFGVMENVSTPPNGLRCRR